MDRVSFSVRQRPRKADQFVQIDNAFLRDTGISIEARGVGAYLLTHDAAFRVTATALGKATGLGRDKLRRVIQELEAAGYLVRERVRDGGKFTIDEFSMSDEKQLVEASDVKTAAADQSPDTAPHKKTNSENINIKKNPPEGDGSADTPPIEEPAFSAKDVVAAYVDSFRLQSGGKDPVGRYISQVGREAKKLIDEGQPPDLIVQAAQQLGRTAYATLERQLTMVLAGSPAAGGSWGRGDVDAFGRGKLDATRMSQEAAAHWATADTAAPEPVYTDEYYAQVDDEPLF